MTKRTIAHAAVVLAALTTAAFIGPAIGADSSSQDEPNRHCNETFDAAQRQDMESFGAYDADAFRAVHRPDAVSVFPDGTVSNGVDEIMDYLASHFRNREATWEYTELLRIVDGCRTGLIVYDTTYGIPRIGYRQRSVVGVTYTWQRGHWRVLSDVNTPVE